MRRTMMKGKIHRATVTDSNLDYEGSITIDSHLLDKANIIPYEQVDIYNVTSGERFTTYAIRGEKDSGVICINGAAAHKAAKATSSSLLHMLLLMKKNWKISNLQKCTSTERTG